MGHSEGFTSLVIPGAGEANFDSLEADPFEGKRRRREREVNSLLDKIPFDLITLDTEMLGRLDKEVAGAAEKVNPEKPGYKEIPYARKTRLDRLKADGKNVEEEDEETEESGDEEEDGEGMKREERKNKKIERADAKKRARGRNSTLKKMLRKRKRNVVDPQTVRLLISLLSPTCAFAGPETNLVRVSLRSPSRRSSNDNVRLRSKPSRTCSPLVQQRVVPQELSTVSASSRGEEPASKQSVVLVVGVTIHAVVAFSCCGTF